MVIDPRMYEKYSGRSGDPYDRLGQALAQSDGRKAERESEKHRLRMAGMVPYRYRIFFLAKPWQIAAIIIGVVVIGLLVKFLAG